MDDVITLTFDVEQLAESMFVHVVCDHPITSIEPDLAHGVWKAQCEPMVGESDWRDEYREQARQLMARLRELVQ